MHNSRTTLRSAWTHEAFPSLLNVHNYFSLRQTRLHLHISFSSVNSSLLCNQSKFLFISDHFKTRKTGRLQPLRCSLYMYFYVADFSSSPVKSFQMAEHVSIFPRVFHTYLCVINVDFDRWRGKWPHKREGYMVQCVKCKHRGRLLYCLLPAPAGPARF